MVGVIDKVNSLGEPNTRAKLPMQKKIKPHFLKESG